MMLPDDATDFRGRTTGLRAWPGWTLLLATIAMSLSTVESASEKIMPAEARQLVLVTTPDWNSTKATLQTFTRAAGGWQSASAPVPVVIGRAGAAWGVGLNPSQAGPQKREVMGAVRPACFRSARRSAMPLPPPNGYAAMTMTTIASMSMARRSTNASSMPARSARRGAGSTEPMRRDRIPAATRPTNSVSSSNTIHADGWRRSCICAPVEVARFDNRRLHGNGRAGMHAGRLVASAGSPVFVLLPWASTSVLGDHGICRLAPHRSSKSTVDSQL
jgi:hypothetical protein